ncbi:FecR family protein [Flexithrix dorotheae]|uniref:FecR family protein n=1 Tax=Flexithrix dorotheae TaxID=70993 RepID=UPI000382A844|nr:FecR family protein [Flexithrix dorotheae]
MEENKILDLIAKKLSNECTAEELLQLNNWLEENKEHQLSYSIIEEYWENRSESQNKRAKQVHDRLFSRINNNTYNEKRKPLDYTKSTGTTWARLNIVTRFAAIFILVIGTTFLVTDINIVDDFEEKNIVEIIVKENEKGKKTQFTLPDGTKIWLNASSKLEFPKVFTGNSREVYLEGQAYFVVAKDTSKPFKVITNNLSTTALGTEFNISAFSDEDEIEIDLTEGKVLIQNTDEQQANKENILIPGKALHFNKLTKEITESKFDLKAATAWKDGIIYFSHASLYSVVDKLERWYGVNIQISGKLEKDWDYTGEFDNENLMNVLESISTVERFEFTLNKKEVLIKL